jgi:lipid-binding SYLF domain-containing protein
VLWRGGKAAAYYNTGGASYGFQAGVQEYGYAMFFMKESALNALDVTQGFEVGVGPSIVIIDQGKGVSHTTTTMQDDIYAFVFNQKGLMAGIGIQGNKITKITK